jgi:hypothetical protein
MPWYSNGSQGAITTSSDANGAWWGTLVSTNGFSPAGWVVVVLTIQELFGIGCGKKESYRNKKKRFNCKLNLF